MAFPGPNNNTDLLKVYGIQIGQVPRPRAPPMFFRPPSPLIMERPQPLVTDVSLIMDSASTSMVSNAESLPNNGGNNSLPNMPNNVSTSQSQPQRKSVSSNSNQVSPKANFANYFPTPSLNQSPLSQGHNELSQSASPRSYSKEDSGQGASVLSASMQGRVPDENGDATDASDELEEDHNDRNGNSRLERVQNEDMKVLKSDVATILKLISQQQETMNKLNSQVAAILASQEKILEYISKSPRPSNEIQTVEQVKTDRETPCQDVKQSSSSTKSKSANQKLRNSKSPTLSGRENSKKQDDAFNKGLRLRMKEPERTVPSSVGERNIEDFSTLLKHLEIDDVQGPSMYSEASIKPNDFPQFNDESFQQNGDSRTDSPNIGPSASAYGSSSEDEDPSGTSPPTVTYYNNLLTTVNRFLDGKDTRNSPECNKQRVTPTTKTVQAFSPRMAPDKPIAVAPGSRSSTATYSSGSSSGGGNKENIFQNISRENKVQAPTRPNVQGPTSGAPESNVVDATKRYLKSIGAGFDSPTPPAVENPNERAKNHQQNYMIQQNVYNSIYIPTVNCVPVIPESLNSNSGMIDNLANKYISPADLNQYEAVTNKNGGMTETTVYGMTSSNLSFATKQYLQRYGLVDQAPGLPQSPQYALTSAADNYAPAHIPPAFKNDRILDITAIRNQPKLL